MNVYGFSAAPSLSVIGIVSTKFIASWSVNDTLKQLVANLLESL